MPNKMKDLELMAIELVSVLPKSGGCRDGMYHDILKALLSVRKDAYRECAELAKDCPHVGEPCCYCGDKIAKAILAKMEELK